MRDFSTLPPHIMTIVLSYLNIADFRNAVLTCKSWYYASCDPKILNKIRTRVTFNAVTVDFLSRPIANLRLDHPNMNTLRYRDLFSNFGRTITELELFVKISMARVFELFIHLPRIKILKLYDGSKFVSELNFHRCRRIERHRDTICKNIGNIRYLTIQVSTRNLELYKIFLNNCKNIEKFYWYGSVVVRMDQGDFMNNYLLNSNENQIFENTIDLVIRSVNLNYRIFESLSNLKLKNLRTLNLAEISLNYYDRSFKDFCKTYGNLNKFGMSSCNNLHLYDICRYMTKLESLEIDNCTAEASLCEIINLDQLKYLHLERREPVIDDSLIQLLNLGLTNLKTLSLNKISADLLNAICGNSPGLEALILVWMDTKQCEPIFRYLLNLRKLHLSFTESVRCHSSRIVSSSEWNITKLLKLEDLYVDYYVPGITPSLIRQLPRVDLEFMDGVYDPTDEELALWDFNADELYHAHQNTGQQTEEEAESVFDLSEFGNCLSLLDNW